jgi:hypothetical protein
MVGAFQCTACGQLRHTTQACMGDGDEGGAHQARTAQPTDGAGTPPAPCKCSTCIQEDDERDHQEVCSKCNELEFVLADVQRLVSWLRGRVDDEHIQHVATQLEQTAKSLRAYRSHLIRHFTQTQAKIDTLAGLKSWQAFLIADWAALRNGTKHEVAQKDGFAQTGRVAIQPTCTMRLATAADDLPKNMQARRDDILVMHRVFFVTDVSNFGPVDTACIIEESIKQYAKLPGNQHVTELFLKADGANEYASVVLPLVLFSEASFIRSGSRIRVVQILRSEAGEGKWVCAWVCV